MTVNEDRFIADFCRSLEFDQTVVVPPGDDCAALDLGCGPLVLVAVDQVAADCHYYGANAVHPTPPELAGRKLLARNLSDIAAMGGTAAYAVVATAVPENCTEERLHAFADGLRQLAATCGVQIIGGDLGRAPCEVASLTIIGKVNREHICLRTKAADQESILVTGKIGNSLPSGRHLTFTPRLDEGSWLARGSWTRCMIDVSDGLLKDLMRICRASEVTAQIDPEAVPVDCPWQNALTDGEDYELLFTVAPEQLAALQEQWPFDTPITEIGRIHSGKPDILDPLGNPLRAEGFDHFSR